MKKNDSVASLCRSVSFTVTTFATIVGLFFFALLFLYGSNNEINHERERLRQVAPLVAQSISGEVFVDDGRTLRAVLPELAKKYSLEKIEVGAADDACHVSSLRTFFHGELCNTFNLLVSGRNVPVVLRSEISFPFRLPLVTFGIIALIGVLVIGISISRLLQARLERALVRPLESLAADPENAESDSRSVTEVASIRNILSAYFAERDKKRVEEENHRLDQRLSEMALKVAHDIRSPLFVLKVLVEDLNGASEPQKGRLHLALARIETIASDLLGFWKDAKSQLDKGQEAERCRPAEIAQQMVAEKELQYRGRTDVRFEWSCEPDAKTISVDFSSALLSRILSNLLNNAVEAIEESGTIAVHQSVADHNVVWRVVDTGRGIPADVLPRVLQGGYSYGKAGHGLGLSTARAAIEQAGGKFEIASSPRGTAIQISLPFALASTPPVHPVSGTRIDA